MNSRGLINEMVFNWGKSGCVLGEPHLNINWGGPEAIIWSHTASTACGAGKMSLGPARSPGCFTWTVPSMWTLLCFSFPSHICSHNVRVKSLEDLWVLMNRASVVGLAELWYYTAGINGAFCLHSLIESVFKCSLTSCEMMHNHGGAQSPSEDFWRLLSSLDKAVHGFKGMKGKKNNNAYL